MKKVFASVYWHAPAGHVTNVGYRAYLYIFAGCKKT